MSAPGDFLDRCLPVFNTPGSLVRIVRRFKAFNTGRTVNCQLLRRQSIHGDRVNYHELDTLSIVNACGVRSSLNLESGNGQDF